MKPKIRRARKAKFDDILLQLVVQYENEDGTVEEVCSEEFYAGEENEALENIKETIKYLPRTVQCPRPCKVAPTCDHRKEHTYSSLCMGHEYCPECTTGGK